MRIEHALGIAGRAGGVAKAGGGALVECLPLKVGVDFADPVLIGDRVLEPGRGHVRRVGQDDIALDRRQMIGQSLEQRHEGQIRHHHPVLGVVDDPSDLLGKETRVDGVVDRADPGDAIPGFEMAVAVPGERGDAVAKPDAVALEAFGDLERALADLAIVRPVHRPLDRPRGDLALRKLDRGEIDDLMHEQGPVLHPSHHGSTSRNGVGLPRLIAAPGFV